MQVTTVEFVPGLYADIHAPAQPGNYPVVTLTMGGSWTLRDRTHLSALADYLASAGIVAINGEHRTLLDGRQLPDMVEDVRCLISAAPQLAAPHLSGPAGPVWLLGFSSGAHLAALAALTDQPIPSRCPDAPPEVAGVIGMAGPYDLDELWSEGILTRLLTSETLAEHLPELAAFVEDRARAAMQLFLRLLTGATPNNPGTWNTVNPIHLARNHPHRSFLLITADSDQVISPAHSDRFADALAAHGHSVATHTVTDVDHFELTDPHTVGEVIVAFLTR